MPRSTFKRLLNRLRRPKVVHFGTSSLDNDARWNELPRELRTNAVKYLRKNLYDLDVLRGWIEEDPENWYARDQNATGTSYPDGETVAIPMPFHFHGGMAVRNLLRDVIKDGELPSGNWDDYYVQALEAAVGKRDV